MHENTLNILMLEAGYAAPDIAVRARKLARLVEAHVTLRLSNRIAMLRILHCLGYSGEQAAASLGDIE